MTEYDRRCLHRENIFHKWGRIVVHNLYPKILMSLSDSYLNMEYHLKTKDWIKVSYE